MLDAFGSRAVVGFPSSDSSCTVNEKSDMNMYLGPAGEFRKVLASWDSRACIITRNLCVNRFIVIARIETLSRTQTAHVISDLVWPAELPPEPSQAAPIRMSHPRPQLANSTLRGG